MASSSAPAAQGQAQAQDENITALKDKLYKACLESPLVSEGFHQRELLEFGIIPDDDLQILLKVAQTLVNEKLFWVFENQDGPGWNIRSVEDAKKYRKLDKEEEMVYGHIDTSGAEGIWIKQLRTKTGLHDALFKAALKRLETKDYVKSIVNVENPTRKVYIKTTIQPSERATGGSWYTDNKLDEEFIDMLMNVLYKYIHSKSFYRSSLTTFNKMKQPKKRITPEEAKSARNKALSQPEVDPDFEARREYSRLLPMPPGYQNYPTLSELTLYIENSPITSETLPPSDIQQLLDILIFDDRIEQVIAGREGVSYKAVRKSFREAQMENEGNVGGRSNALTEAPCGRCPVFDLCEEGGPVGPSNCEYFETWLGF